MKHPILNISTIFLAIIALSAFIFSVVEVAILKRNPPLSLEENGILEFSQVIVLVGVSIMYLVATFKNNNNERWISMCFFAIFYIFILRELGVKHMDVPDYVKYIFSGTGRTITAIILIAISLIGALKNYKHYIIKTIELLFSKRGILLWLSFVFLQLGQWLEKGNTNFYILCEENLELIGYCLILFCAYKTLKLPPLKRSINF
ncbi:MAG: hypothetical protein R3Y46_00530 [Opitutales bacterium]